MKINQTKGGCHYKTFSKTYLDPNFRMKLGEARSSYFEETVAETHCNDAGQACAGIIRDNGATSAGRDWSRYPSYNLQRRSRLGSARKSDFIDSGRIPLYYWKRTLVGCP
jgi:hypothetical protein